MANLEKEASDYQIELFQLVAEFFGRAIGILPSDFATIDGFGDEIRKQGPGLAYRFEDAFTWADKELRRFYAEKGPTIFRLASRIGGLKLVLGGSSRFLASQLQAVKGSLLYADTILIPDPVAPWLENDRKEEKFRHVLMLQAAHALLHLKAIVDAELPHCPILVFPSWEKMLEHHDPQTIKGTFQLLSDFLAQYVDPSIGSMDEARYSFETAPTNSSGLSSKTICSSQFARRARRSNWRATRRWPGSLRSEPRDMANKCMVRRVPPSLSRWQDYERADRTHHSPISLAGEF